MKGPGAGDAGVIRIKGSQRGLAMALDGNGRWCYLDPQLGAMHAVADAARNVACSGATPVGATNCLNFGNPEKPHIMWQFSKVIDGITKACEELDVPITGGNVSFYNETLGEGIYPTPVIGIVGILEDVHKAVFPHFREPGRVVVLLRASEPGDLDRCGIASLDRPSTPRKFWARCGDFLRRWNWNERRRCRKALVEMIGAGLVESAHDCSEGGIAVTLAESAFAKGIGVRGRSGIAGIAAGVCAVRRGCEPGRDLVRPEQSAGNPTGSGEISAVRGRDRRDSLPSEWRSRLDGRVVVSAAVSELREAYEGALEAALQADPRCRGAFRSRRALLGWTAEGGCRHMSFAKVQAKC